MDYTQDSLKVKNERSRKHMLWFGIVSLSMVFAGLTSAFIVSSSRGDWLKDFQLPNEFIYSTIIIIISSMVLTLAQKALAKHQIKQAGMLTLITLLLGGVFVYVQFAGFESIIELGYYFTGDQSKITTTFVYLIAIAHMAHVAAGLIVLLTILIRTYQNKYNGNSMLGYVLGAQFWHYLDILWVLLFAFLYLFFHFQTT